MQCEEKCVVIFLTFGQLFSITIELMLADF